MANIQKKNLKSRKGTQRWRKNIIVPLLQNNDVQFPGVKAKEIGYEIDTKPINIYENKDRFKKVIDESQLSRTEQKRIKGLKIPARNEPKKAIVDIWDSDIKVGKPIPINEVKAVVTPHAGQSYNPQYQQYQELVDKVVAQELRSQQKLSNQKETEEDKLKRKQEQEQKKQTLDKVKRLKKQYGHKVADEYIEKQVQHQVTLVKKIKKDIDEDAKKKLERQRKLKLKQKLLEKTHIETGRLLQPKKKGKKILKQTEDEIVLEDDLKSKLRHVSQGDMLVRSQFESWQRRGIIEPKSKSNKLAHAKVPLFKIKERGVVEQEEKSAFKTMM